MFNKKLLSVIAYVLAALLIVKVIFVLTMFVWSYFGMAPVSVFGPPGPPTAVTYLILLQEIGTIAFIYLIIAAIQKLVSHPVKGMVAAHVPVAAAAKPAAKTAAKKPARRRPRTKTGKAKK